MKKIALILALFSLYAVKAMENEEADQKQNTPFTQEGLVEKDPENNFSGVLAWNYYDGSGIKSMMFPQLKQVIAEQHHAIIKRKLGADFLEYYKQHEKAINMQPVTRYSHAVCWRFLGDIVLGKSGANLQRAEQQVPLNEFELAYIVGVDTLKKNFENSPQAEQRKHLNEFLNTLKRY